MRIGIDISPLAGGHAGRGTGMYTRELLSGFKRYSKLDIYEVINKKDLETVDLIHFPYFDPFFLTLPFTNKPFVVTIHDLIPLRYPRQFPRGIKGEIKWQVQKMLVKRADAVITDSQASKTDILQMLHMSDSRVTVIPLASGSSFYPVADNSKLEQVKKTYDLPQEFLLYVGDVNWNKNITGLVHAVKSLNLPLVLVGKAFLNKTLPEVHALNQLIEQQELRGKIKKVGFVSADDLSSIYSLARLTLCVSYAEGFGFPILESMACGTPCVVSDCSSLKEIAGPSVLVDPWNVQDITRGINEALKKEKKAEGKKAIEWANAYSWQRVAEETERVYRNVLLKEGK